MSENITPEECLEKIKEEFVNTGLYKKLNYHTILLEKMKEDVKNDKLGALGKVSLESHQKAYTELLAEKKKYFERRLNELLIKNGLKEPEKKTEEK